MGFKIKAGTKGNAVNYTTRNQALKRLQLKLSQFRRLCILKGIHPREPKKKRQGQNKTYYHVKDINFLLHEPLLDKFREIRAYDKKVSPPGGGTARTAPPRPPITQQRRRRRI
jgi:pescadillo protein